MSDGDPIPGFRPADHPLFSGAVDVPPAPRPGSVLLAALIDRGMRGLEGPGGRRPALLDLAVHAWMEGHLAGEDACPGCTGTCGWPRTRERAAVIGRACGDPAPVARAAAGPVPPFPHPADPVLAALVTGAEALLDAGRPATQAVPMLAARAWAEGHAEGEDRCPGCAWRGGLPQGVDRDALLRERLGKGNGGAASG